MIIELARVNQDKCLEVVGLEPTPEFFLVK